MRAVLACAFISLFIFGCTESKNADVVTPTTATQPKDTSVTQDTVGFQKQQETQKKEVIDKALGFCNEAVTKDKFAICRAIVKKDVGICEETGLKDTYALCRAIVKKDITVCEETALKDTYALCRALIKSDINLCEDAVLKDTYAICRATIKNDIAISAFYTI